MDEETIAMNVINRPSPFAINKEEVVITHLGPYDVSEVTDDILGGVVVNEEVPIIIKQDIRGEVVYAVLAKDKDVRIACAGCFSRDMRITDATRCKKCSSFVKHWDTKDGDRRAECKTDIAEVAENCRPIVMDFAPKKGLGDFDTDALIEELKKRGEVRTLDDLEFAADNKVLDEVKARDLEQVVIQNSDEEVLAQVMMNRGIYPIYEARPTRLIHELRRQVRNISIRAYYCNAKKRTLPHSTDPVGAELIETSKRVKKAARFEPRAVDDFNLD